MVCQKSEALNLPENTLHNEYLQVQLFRQQGGHSSSLCHHDERRGNGETETLEEQSVSFSYFLFLFEF